MYEVSKPRLISEYLYTDEALDAQPGASFLYVATKSGLETWTMRPGWTKDAGIAEPMVIGLQAFISLKKIVLAGDSVILLSKCALSYLRHPRPKRTPMLTRCVRFTESELGSRQLKSKAVAAKKASTNEVSWSLYILHPIPVIPLYDQIIARACDKVRLCLFVVVVSSSSSSSSVFALTG